MIDRLAGHGDIREIALISGFNISYVRKVLTENRNNEVIYDIAMELASMRDRIRSKYKFLKVPHKSGRQLSEKNRIENVLIDLQFRPARRLIETVLRRVETLHGQIRSESLFYLRRELELYDRHIIKSLDWLYRQKIMIGALREPIHLPTMVESSIDILSPHTTGHTIVNDLPNDSPELSADPFLAGLLLRSLLYQLVRITAPGGTIRFYTPPAPAAKGTATLAIEITPCLLSSHNFRSLNKAESLQEADPRIESPETVAIASHYIMHLQEGSITYTMDTDKVGSILMHFRKDI